METAMPHMTRVSNLASAMRRLRDDMRTDRSNGCTATQVAHVLRRDGDTDTVRMDGQTGRVTVTRTAGHITLGMHVDPTDLPCIIA